MVKTSYAATCHESNLLCEIKNHTPTDQKYSLNKQIEVWSSVTKDEKKELLMWLEITAGQYAI